MNRARNPDRVAHRAQRRRDWSAMAQDAGRLADRLIDSDGAESVEGRDLRHMLKVLADEGFPSDEASARMAGEGFTRMLRATLTASLPRRRVILATVLKAEAKAIDELIVDTQETEALAWRAMTGEA